MAGQGIDQLIISSPRSIYYLLGNTIEPHERLFALTVDADGTTRLFVNELDAMHFNSSGVDITTFSDAEDSVALLANLVKGGNTIGIDKDWPSQFLLRLMDKADGHYVIGSRAVDETRMIKDDKEISRLRNASQINDTAMTEAMTLVQAGLSESEVGEALEKIYRNHSTTLAFSLICYGANAAEPHHNSDDTRLGDNQCVIIDIGGVTKGYYSDMTRSFFKGTPDDEYQKIYETVLNANLAGINAVKPGIHFADIDRAARDVIDKAGYGEYFIHRTGHNIGLDGHEYPDVGVGSEVMVQPGMTFSIEPGIYIPGKYGVRIEDIVLVTENGCEVLNDYSKEFATIN